MVGWVSPAPKTRFGFFRGGIMATRATVSGAAALPPISVERAGRHVDDTNRQEPIGWQGLPPERARWGTSASTVEPAPMSANAPTRIDDTIVVPAAGYVRASG